MLHLSLVQQLKPSLLISGGILLGLESVYLSQSFDAASLILDGQAGGWRALFGHFGDLAKLALVITVVIGLLLSHSLKRYGEELCDGISHRRFLTALPIQLLSYLWLYTCTSQIYSAPATAHELPALQYLSWLASLLITVTSWLFMLVTPSWLTRFIRTEKKILMTGIFVGLAVWSLAFWTQRFWGPLSELTFYLAASALQLFHEGNMVVNIDQKVIGVGDFWVNIAPACSGYEGIGLITAFTGIYLWVQRHQLHFPRAWLLFPIGAISIWLLNVARIVILINIGHSWSPEVAVGGFHSQAGWITFILTSLAILWLAGDSDFFCKNPVERKAFEPTDPASPLAIATLIPMVVLLSISLLSSAFTADFDWLYPIRVLAVAIALAYVWKTLRPLQLPSTWLAPAAGLLTAVLWIGLLGTNPEANQQLTQSLATIPTWLAALWLFFRFVGTTITVPLAEELAFRGYLLCRFSKTEVTMNGFIPFSVVAIVFSSLIFGLLHGAWFAGTVAGVIYAYVRWRTQKISEAIYAHGVTNALLFGYAAFTGEWHLL